MRLPCVRPAGSLAAATFVWRSGKPAANGDGEGSIGTLMLSIQPFRIQTQWPRDTQPPGLGPTSWPPTLRP